MYKYIKKMQNYLASFYLPVILSIPIAPILGWFEKYVFGDWEFLKFLVVLMIVDTLLGLIIHTKKRDLSVQGFEKIIIKVICYGAALIVAHNLSSYRVLGEVIEGFNWFRTTICSSLIIRESLSILNGIQNLYPNILPARVRKYLKYYDDKGEFKKNDKFEEK